MKSQEARHILTRLSLAVVFIGIGLWEIIQPSAWSFYVPAFIPLNANLFTMMQGTALAIMGAGVLLGIYLRVFSALAALMMLAILVDLVMLFGFNDLVIRDSGVLLIALALFFDDVRYKRLTKV